MHITKKFRLQSNIIIIYFYILKLSVVYLINAMFKPIKIITTKIIYIKNIYKEINK